MKNLYKISQTVNTDFDTYDSAIVCEESEDYARLTHPDDRFKWSDGWRSGDVMYEKDSWCAPKDVKVELIGVAHKDIELGAVICSSFNAG